MTFIDRLNELLKQKGVSAHKMSLQLGLSKSVYTAWKERGNTPPGDVLNKLADYFDVSVDYLLGRVDNPHSEIPVALSAPQGYENLTDEQKELIQALIDQYAQRNK